MPRDITDNPRIPPPKPLPRPDAERKAAPLEDTSNIYSRQTELLASIAISLKRIADALDTKSVNAELLTAAHDLLDQIPPPHTDYGRLVFEALAEAVANVERPKAMTTYHEGQEVEVAAFGNLDGYWREAKIVSASAQGRNIWVVQFPDGLRGVFDEWHIRAIQ